MEVSVTLARKHTSERYLVNSVTKEITKLSSATTAIPAKASTTSTTSTSSTLTSSISTSTTSISLNQKRKKGKRRDIDLVDGQERQEEHEKESIEEDTEDNEDDEDEDESQDLGVNEQTTQSTTVKEEEDSSIPTLRVVLETKYSRLTIEEVVSKILTGDIKMSNFVDGSVFVTNRELHNGCEQKRRKLLAQHYTVLRDAMTPYQNETPNRAHLLHQAVTFTKDLVGKTKQNNNEIATLMATFKELTQRKNTHTQSCDCLNSFETDFATELAIISKYPFKKAL